MCTSWNNEIIINFINAIRLRSCLWDNTHVDYRNRNLKKDEWKAVATEFGISVEEAQKKFKNLRTYFNNEIKKGQKKQRSGSGASQDCNWFAFKTMLFLKDVDEPDPGEDSESQLNRNENSPEESPQSTQSPLPPSAIPAARQKKKKRNDESEQYETAIQVMDDVRKKLNNRSLSFGNHVNEKLLSYSEFVRSQVEYKISTILYEADMGYYDRQTSRIGSSNSSSYQYSPQTELVPSSLLSPQAETSHSYSTHNQKAYSSQSRSQSSCSSNTLVSIQSPETSPVTDRPTEINKEYEVLVSKAVGDATDTTKIVYESAQMYSGPFSY